MNRIARILTTATAAALISTTSALAQSPNTAPALKIITPADSQTIYGGKIPILFAVEKFQLVDYQKNTSLVAGQGHIHVWLDDQNPTKESARKITADSTTYTDVPYGDHVLRAELVNNNHTSLTPAVVSTVKFKSAPAASPSPAVSSGFDKNTALVILVVVALVIVAAWWYTKEEDEETPAKSKVESRKSKSARTKASKKRRSSR